MLSATALDAGPRDRRHDDQRGSCVGPNQVGTAPADNSQPHQDRQRTEGIAAMVPGDGDDRCRTQPAADANFVTIQRLFDQDVDRGEP